MGTNSDTIFSFNYWLPKELQSLDDQGLALQAQFFVIFASICIPSMVALNIALMALSYLNILDLYAIAAGGWFVFFMQLACLLYFKHTGNVQVSTFFFSIAILFATSSIILLTGGWDSEAVSYWLALYVMICLMVGRGMGIFFSFFVLLMCGTVFFLDEYGHPLPTIVDLEDTASTVVAGIMRIATLFTIVGCLLLYDYSTAQISAAIEKEKKQLDFDAHYDSLTKTYNKQALVDKITHLNRKKSDYSVTFIKINNLSDINRQFGYDSGDRFLIKLIDNINENTTKESILARYASDSFVFIIKHIDNPGQLISNTSQLQKAISNTISLEDGASVKADFLMGTLLACSKDLPAEKIISAAKYSINNDSSLYMRI